MKPLLKYIYTGLPRADVEYSVFLHKGEAFVLLHDLDIGSRSLTNDALAVMQDVERVYPGVKYATIVYRDSESIYDQIVYNGVEVKFITHAALDFEEFLVIRELKRNRNNAK